MINSFWICALLFVVRHLRTAIENPIHEFPEKELRRLSPNFHTHVSVSNLDSQDRSTYFPATE